MNLPAVVLTLVWFISSGVHAVCQSYGTDFQDGGSYCIDPRLTDVFSFGTEWYGCTANDTQDGVDPYISGPDGEGQYCSNIQTNPDGQEMISTCNVDGDALTKNNMYSGNWTIGFYGLTFAYQREFYLNVEIPETVISTPTVSITITDTPSTTETSITTYTSTTTLEAETVTVPSATVIYTITETPPLTITTVTQTIFSTVQSFTFSESTTVSTYTCSGNPWRLLDPSATWTPAVVAASLASQSAPTPTGGRIWPPFGGGIIPGLPWFGPGHANVEKDAVAAHVTARGLLAKRTPDACTITSVANSTQSVTVTTTAPTSTITVPEATTVTATVYPDTVTSYAGEASETITVTLPAETLTRLQVTRGVTTATVEIVVTATSTLVVAPSGIRCIGGLGGGGGTSSGSGGGIFPWNHWGWGNHW